MEWDVMELNSRCLNDKFSLAYSIYQKLYTNGIYMTVRHATRQCNDWQCTASIAILPSHII